MSRLVRFALKSRPEKQATVRFFSRRALSKIPFVPMEVGLDVGGGHELQFWWSYISEVNHPERPFGAYWGDDCGELRFVWQFLRSGMTFFDVGAYHGIFSIVAALKVGSQGRVIAFEPSPRERRRFEFHIRMNGVSNVGLEGRAVGARSALTKFFTVVSGFTTMNSLQPPAQQAKTREIEVSSISLDEYLTEHSEIPPIDLMKIDVEGGELDAFYGADHLLADLRPILICEVLDLVTQQWGYEAREIIKSLEAKGYLWFDFLDDGNLRHHIVREQYPEVRNYLAVPKEKIDLISRWLHP